ncbi:MAG TPA: hypothetical protein VKO20_00255 [Desulfosalsimonadaceae bacterium]|nr:hypothetical protein [Desulfosalsimonadaceae bacterium]
MMDSDPKKTADDNFVECFGQFNFSNTICRNHCALRLRCAIEQGEQTRIEQLEDWMAVQEMPSKIQ